MLPALSMFLRKARSMHGRRRLNPTRKASAAQSRGHRCCLECLSLPHRCQPLALAVPKEPGAGLGCPEITLRPAHASARRPSTHFTSLAAATIGQFCSLAAGTNTLPPGAAAAGSISEAHSTTHAVQVQLAGRLLTAAPRQSRAAAPCCPGCGCTVACCARWASTCAETCAGDTRQRSEWETSGRLGQACLPDATAETHIRRRMLDRQIPLLTNRRWKQDWVTACLCTLANSAAQPQVLPAAASGSKQT